MSHYGIDISSNNGHPIDYPTVVAHLRQLGGGTQPFVIVKATQGTGYTNPYFSEDVHGFAAAGAAVGAYLMDQGNNDPAAEETYFRKVAGGLPQFDDDELPMGNNAYAQHCAALVAQQPAALDYLNQSEEDGGYPAGAGLWEANYNGQPGVTHRPGVLIHQYADNGTVPGIAGQVDMNVWLGSDTAFAQTFHLTTPPPAPPAQPSEDEPVKVVVSTPPGGNPGQYLIRGHDVLHIKDTTCGSAAWSLWAGGATTAETVPWEFLLWLNNGQTPT
jgi:GH25 family lysozyme M1 (1,4-beta-N-acetylmuramidase)